MEQPGVPLRFDAVIFDLYGTLVDSPDSPSATRAAYDAVTTRVAGLVGAPPESFRDLWRRTFSDRMTGAHPSLEAYVTALCRELGVAPRPDQVAEAARLRVDLFRGRLVPRTDCLDTLAALRAMGHRIGLITDCSWETPSLWPETPLPPYFDVTTFSCETGTRKPDPRIFALTWERLGVVPARCLYVGDGNSDELAGAERAGMTSLRIHVPYETMPDAADPWPGPSVSALSEVLGWVR